MRRILSHVEPSSNTPRNLLHDVRRQLSGAVPGEIPWCKEVTAADVAGRMGPSTGYRSPPCSFNPVAASSSGPADGAKASAIAKIDAEAEALDQIALQLWKNPELGCAPAPLTLPPRLHTARRLTGICVSFCAQTTSRLRTGASRISWRRRRARRWSVASATSRPHSAPSTTPARTARKLLTRPSPAAARSQPAAGGLSLGSDESCGRAGAGRLGSAASTTPSPASATPAATTSSPRPPSRASSAPSQPSSQRVRRAGSS